MPASTSTLLYQGGSNNGQGTTLDTRVSVPWIKTVTVSKASKDTSFTLPDNSYLYSSYNYVTEKVSGIADGVKIVIGDGSTDNLYGTTNNVSALGVYAATLTQSAVSAKTISVKVTASTAASAAELTGVSINVSIVGGITSTL